MIIFRDPIFLEHRPPYAHPECPERLQVLAPVFQESRQELREAALLPEEQLGLVHSAECVRLVKQLAAGSGGQLEPDTYVCPRSYEVALAAAGTVAEAARTILRGECRASFAAIRPPGHHATTDNSMGFCLFNNIAIAARLAMREFSLPRVAIVDWDVHHGNGTQEIFYSEPSVLYISLHRYPHFYPGTGSTREIGAGNIANYPLPSNTTAGLYIATFRRAVEERLLPFAPKLILVSAGFDPLDDDPIGGLGLSPEHFGEITNILVEAARDLGVGIASALEGGYHLGRLPLCVKHHIEALNQL